MRRPLTLLAISGLLLALAAPGAVATTDEERSGEAVSTTSLLDIVSDVEPLADGVSLATIVALATTEESIERNPEGEGEPFAAIELVPHGTDPIHVRSDDEETSRPGTATSLPGGLGSLAVGELSATADDDSAEARLAALSGFLTTPLMDVTVALPVAGMGAGVDPETATATNGGSVTGLSVGLEDVLGADLLAQLPLSVLIDLLAELPVELPPELQELLDLAVVQLAELIEVLEELADLDLDGVDAALEAARAEAAALLGDDELSLAEIRTAVDELHGDRDALLTSLDLEGDEDLDVLLEGATADLTAAQETITAAEEALEALAEDEPVLCTLPLELAELCEEGEPLEPDDEAALVGLVAELTDQIDTELQPRVDDLAQLIELTDRLDELADLLATVDMALDGIADLADDLLEAVTGVLGLDLDLLVDGIVEAISEVELFTVEDITVSATATATAIGSSAEATCVVEGAVVLGEPLAEDAECADLIEALADVEALLDDVLAVLPIAEVVDPGGDLLDDLPEDPIGDLFEDLPEVTGELVVADGLTTETTDDDEIDGTHYIAFARVLPLRLGVASVELEAVVDELLGTVIALLGDEPDALAGVVGELADIDTQELAGAIEALLADLDGLAVELPEGLVTPGLGLRAAQISAATAFETAGGVTPIDPPPPPTTPPGAQSPAAQPTRPTPTSHPLPRTGGAALLPLAALALAGAGWSLRRPRE